MPQSPLAADVALTPSNVIAPLRLDTANNCRTIDANDAVSSSLNLTTATAVKATPGRAVALSVLVAGSGVGAVYDHATTSGVAAGNQIFVIPETVGIYLLNWPCAVGIVVAPGTGQTVAIAYV